MTELTPEIEDQIDAEVRKRSGCDIALWFHHKAILSGEWRVRQKGDRDWEIHQRTLRLSQFREVEESVINGWRMYIRATTGIRASTKRDTEQIERALVYDELRRKVGTPELAGMFVRRSHIVFDAARNGDVDFFRAIGKLLSEKKPKDSLKRMRYAHNVLSRWITERYWLMPPKAVSLLMSIGSESANNVKSLLAFKGRYKLKSHCPALVARVVMHEGCLVSYPTKEGKALLL
jgi:hypothetical protein